MNNKMMKSNPMLTLAAILLCLVMISTHFTSGLYAKYTARSSTNDNARVASFVIETELDHISLGTSETPTLQLGGTDEVNVVELPFYIASGSEVAVGYSVTVDFGTTPIPEYIDISLSNGIASQTLAANGSKTQFVFADFGTLPAASLEEQKANLVLTISISDLSMITEEISIPTAQLTVRVNQVD